MKISENYPPNYEEIKKYFPHLEEHKPVFCYGDTIYNPFKGNVTKDIIAHEQVHSKQQGEFPEVWYYNYFVDTEFRLQQEIEAYGEQYVYCKREIKNKKLLEWCKEKFAQSLSGPLYGNLLSFGEAESKIRNYAKNN